MKYLSIPLNLIKFWYPESLTFFLRTWKNCLLYLEEDLAVGLMFKLLFVPLFHDSSFTGRILSFFFRSLRILLGLLAFFLVSIAVFALALAWFLLPLLPFILEGWMDILAKGLLFSGVVLFVNHLVSHPPKKVWQIKSPQEVWQASFLKSKDLDFVKLLKTEEVKNLLLYLEETPENFLKFAKPKDEKLVLEKAFDLGKKLGMPYFLPEHFFVSCLLSFPNVEQELLKIKENLKIEDFIDVLEFFQRRRKHWRVIPIWDEDFKVKHLKGVNRGWLGVPTPNLDLVSEDLTKKASKEFIPDFVGRRYSLNQVINILSLDVGRNALIVGEGGSGKDTLVNYLAKMIVSGDAPESISTKRLVKLDLTKLLNGIKSQGELAERLKNIFEEVEYSGNIIIFAPEIHNLGIGEVGSEFNLYSLLLPFIEGSKFQFIATTEPANYSRVVEKNSNFAMLFTKIELPEASETETISILKNQAIEIERYKKIKTSLLAIKAMASLSKEYIHERVLPDSALQVFLQCETKAENNWIKKSIVEKVVEGWTHVPVGRVEIETKYQLLNLEKEIHKKMVNQQEAVVVIADTLRRAAAGLREKSRPIGSFLFVGPTGVGKTELAKTLVEVYFQGKGKFVRLDMSEYQTLEAALRLIGKVGEGGQLTEVVRNNPYSLILLDEFEKADPKVLTLFLQILDDGRLTDGMGRTIDFTNTIIIATSNAGSLTIAQGLERGQSLEQLKEKVHLELLQIFKPELINRFDEVVLFKPLSKEDLQKIVLLKLSDLQKMLENQGFLVEFTPGLIEKLAEKGYDPALGARPLRRLIQDSLEAKLSIMILENKIPKGEKFTVGEDLITPGRWPR